MIADRADRGNEVVILGEDELKRMSRQVKDLLPRREIGGDDRIKVTNLSNSLFATASSPCLQATHRVASWNTLCAFIDELTRSQFEEIRNFLWDYEIWLAAWRLYIEDSQHARPKSAKQLLLTLSNALRKCDDAESLQLSIIQSSSKLLRNYDHPRQTKACLQLLTQLFGKDLLQVTAIDRALSDGADRGKTQASDASVHSLLCCLFQWANQEDLGSVVSRCISTVLDKYDELLKIQGSAHRSITSRGQPVWLAALERSTPDIAVNEDQLRNYIFPVLFKRSLSDYSAFLWAHGLGTLTHPPNAHGGSYIDQSDRQMLFAALQSGKDLGMITETDHTHIHEDAASIMIPAEAYASLLSDWDRNTRIIGLSLLINSHSATRPFLPISLKLLKQNLPTFFADADAFFRSEVFSLMQRLMDRLRAITAVLARATHMQETRSASANTSSELRRHRAFIPWLLRSMAWELRPSASYQRHISALKSISIVARSGIDPQVPAEYWSKSASAETRWPFRISVLQAGLRKSLMDLLINPFDDVRQTASSILAMYTTSLSSESQMPLRIEVVKSIERGEATMLATGRADEADGVAHMYSLLARLNADRQKDLGSQSTNPNVLQGLISDLESMLENAHRSLSAAAKRYPMHGIVTSIQYILCQSDETSNEQLSRLTKCLCDVWQTVKPVLCNDAPEGFELEGADESADSSTKDILSYCWRALKESSLLLGTLVTRKQTDAANLSILSSLCFTQLAELRHRGAFSTVAQTWVTCCSRAVLLNSNQQRNPLIEDWYGQTFDILKNKTTINTRRSAGIPSLLCGLLIADRTGALLFRAFSDLSAIAKEPVDTAIANEGSLPQVHALNCIKDTLKNTRLGEQSERLVPLALRLAADSLQSEAWAIRNCGLMLFRAVIDRLLGTSDAYLEDDAFVQRRISAQQHPDLLQIVLSLLVVSPRPSGDNASPRFEGVFPALQMLQRIDVPHEQRQSVQDAVLGLTSSPSWSVRDKAARTYASLMSGFYPTGPIGGQFESEYRNANALHGTLLCLKYVVRAYAATSSRSGRSKCSKSLSRKAVERVIDTVATAWDRWKQHGCPVIRAVVYDIIAEQMHLPETGAQDDPVKAYLKFAPLFLLLSTDILVICSGEQPLDSARAVERASFARAFACSLVLEDTSDIGCSSVPERDSTTMALLGHRDADACSEFWRTLRIERKGNKIKSDKYIPFVLRTAAQVLSSVTSIRLRCDVQHFLLHLADEGCATDEFIRTCAAGPSPVAEDSNQQYADQWLQLRPIVLDSRLRLNNGSAGAVDEFISSCKAAVAGGGFYSREAAASAISRMEHLWPFISTATGPIACDAYLIVYDLLNDDDEDNRLLAAKIVSRILHSANFRERNTHFEPITASQHLLGHMLTHLHHSRRFATEAFTRAFNNTNDAAVDLLHEYTQQSTALFAQEKQNLYIDEAREVKAWTQVLLRLPVASIPKRLIRDLTSWIDEGLFTLTSRLRKGGRDRNNDNGALGWMSKAEVFVLGLQVISGVEVLFRYLSKGGRLPMEGSEILRRLAGLQEALEEEGGSGLWRWEVERVVRGLVEGRVRLAWALAGKVREGAKEGPLESAREAAQEGASLDVR